MATDCERYLTGPKDLLDNYTDPTGQLDKYITSFYLVGALDCKRYLTGPEDLLDNYTDPTEHPLQHNLDARSLKL